MVDKLHGAEISKSHTMAVKPDQNILLAAKGGGIIFLGGLIMNGLRLLIGVLMARLLGAEQFGLINLALSVSMVAGSLAALGLEPAMVRYVSVFASRRDNAKLWGTLQVGFGLSTSLSLLVGAILFVLAGPIAEHLFHEPRLVILLRLASLVIPFTALSNVACAVTQGFKRMEFDVISRKVVSPITRLILLGIIALTLGLNATSALLTYNIAITVGFVLLMYFLNKLFPLRRPFNTAQRDVGQILRFYLPTYFAKLIQTFRGQIQIVLLGAVSSISNVGIFTVASQVNIIGGLFHAGLATSSGPIISELHDRGDRERLRQVYQTVTKLTFTLNLPLFLVTVLFPTSILSIFGESFAGGVAILSILAWTNLINTGTGLCGDIISMTGRSTLRLVNTVIMTILSFGLNFLLIPQWGALGAAIASLMVSIFFNTLALVEVFVLYRLQPYNMSFVKPVVAGGVALMVGLGMRTFLPDANIITLGINGLIVSGVYIAVIMLLGLSPDEYMILARLKGRISKKLNKDVILD